MQSAEIYLPFYDGDNLQGEMAFPDIVKLTHQRLTILKNLDTVYLFHLVDY